VATSLLRIILTGLIERAGLGGVNRMLGAGFGFARGLILLVALTLVGGLTDLPQKPAWRDALLARPLEEGALMLRPWLPPILADNIRYPDNG